MRKALVVTGLAASVALVACGNGGGEMQGPAAGSAPKRPGLTVDMVDSRFEPKRLTVARGETVTFRNRGKLTHNAKGRSFFSRVVEPGGVYRHRFDDAGTFAYMCTFHPGMTGTLRVE